LTARRCGCRPTRCLQHEIDHLDGILFLDRVESASAVFRRRDYG
jgi:peptide deformylase